MKGFAIHNAPTDHGGRIPATQMMSSQMGNLFVVAGDGHLCPKCKCWSTVLKSHDHVIFDGKAVAYVGDKLTCGARILPQQSHVVGDSGGGNYQGSNKNIVSNVIGGKKFDEQLKIIFNDEGDDIFKFLDCKVNVGGVIYAGKLDEHGNTTRFFTESKEEIKEIEFFFKDNIVYFDEL